MIEVRLFATFREEQKKILFLDSKDIKTAKDVMAYLKIDYKDVAILLINGRHSKQDDIVSDGDVVALFPPVGGG